MWWLVCVVACVCGGLCVVACVAAWCVGALSCGGAGATAVGLLLLLLLLLCCWEGEWRLTVPCLAFALPLFQKHESHLSQRSTYTDRDRGGLVFFDGEPHIKFHSDIKFRSVDGDHANVRGGVWSGAMFYVPGDGASDLSIELALTIAAGGTGVGGGWSARRDGETRGDPGRFYWYGDHDTIYPDPPSWATGGVACCSTTDMVSWRNEGIMFHYNNMTDDVLGSDDSLHAERPKVMYNPHTKMFVMWMHADNAEIGIRSAGVALSQWANGPYGMLHTIRPDGALCSVSVPLCCVVWCGVVHRTGPYRTVLYPGGRCFVVFFVLLVFTYVCVCSLCLSSPCVV